MPYRLPLVALALCCALACDPVAPPPPPTPAPQPAAAIARPTVLFFLAVDCPISNSYAPEIARICTDYAARDVDFLAVYPDPDTTWAQAARHRADYALPCPAKLDPDHRLVDLAGATITPEVALLTPGPAAPRLLYRGRIDDRYYDYGKPRPAPTTHDLRNALDAFFAGKLPDQPVITKSLGCHIPEKSGQSAVGSRQ